MINDLIFLGVIFYKNNITLSGNRLFKGVLIYLYFN